MGSLREEELPAGSVVALDTPVFVYFLEHHPRYYAAARALLRRIERGEVAGALSSLVFAELLVPAYRAGDRPLAKRILGLLTAFPHLQVVDVSPRIAAQAAELRAAHGLRTPDAIHAATALAAQAAGIVTNDRHFDRLAGRLTVWGLDGAAA